MKKNIYMALFLAHITPLQDLCALQLTQLTKSFTSLQQSLSSFKNELSDITIGEPSYPALDEMAQIVAMEKKNESQMKNHWKHYRKLSDEEKTNPEIFLTLIKKCDEYNKTITFPAATGDLILQIPVLYQFYPTLSALYNENFNNLCGYYAAYFAMTFVKTMQEKEKEEQEILNTYEAKIKNINDTFNRLFAAQKKQKKSERRKRRNKMDDSRKKNLQKARGAKDQAINHLFALERFDKLNDRDAFNDFLGNQQSLQANIDGDTIAEMLNIHCPEQREKIIVAGALSDYDKQEALIEQLKTSLTHYIVWILPDKDNATHWITLLARKNATKNIEFIIADSAGHDCRSYQIIKDMYANNFGA